MTEDRPLSNARIVVMAAACAFAVATIYYNQPLLALMGATFGRSAADAGIIATLTQMGYAAGLVLFVPLGDRVDRKRLLTAMLGANVASLAACALAPSFLTLACASFALGITAPTAQVIIPAISGLASPELRGRTVGALLSGLSAGMLLARAFSGAVGAHLGWRAVFGIATIFDAGVIAIVLGLMPAIAPTVKGSYGALLGSLWTLLRTQPILRSAALSGFLLFGAFSTLWGALASLLGKPPYGYHADIVGAFGLIGIVGVTATPLIGRFADRIGAMRLLRAGAFIVIVGLVLVSQTLRSLGFLFAAMVLLDIGNRSGMLANQLRIYALLPDARSRLNTVFMTCYFLGGAVGTAAGAYGGAVDGWHGLARVGASFAIIGMLLAVFRLPRPLPGA